MKIKIRLPKVSPLQRLRRRVQASAMPALFTTRNANTVKPYTLALPLPLFLSMDLISLLIVLIVVGVILWLINTYIPMAAPIKTVINVVVILILCLWLLNFAGIGHTLYLGPRHP